jgi:hypothetical protein
MCAVACKESQAEENVIFQPWKEGRGEGGGEKRGKDLFGLEATRTVIHEIET